MVSITNADLEIYVTENSVTTVIWKDNARVLAFGDVVRITDRDGIRYEFLYTDVIAPTSPAWSSADELADEINTYLITIPGGGGGGIDLETNGIPNGDQTKLNLVEGANMTITDDGMGNITFDAAGGGGGIEYGVASGTNTYSVTISGVTSYTDGDTYVIKFTNGNDDDSSININGLGAKDLVKQVDVRVTGGDIIAGQDLIIIYDGTNFQTIGVAPNQFFAYVTNDDSVTITKGQPVYAFGAAGNRMSVKLAANTSDATSAQTVGVVFSSSIAAGQKGFIITQGVISGVNTAAYSPGDQLYLGATAGTLTATKPVAPNHLVYIGIVERANAGNGQIYIKPQNGYELDELHDVLITSPQNNQFLVYETGTPNLWKNKSLGTVLGGTTSQYVRGDGTLQTNASSIVTILDGQGGVIQTGRGNNFLSIPFSGTITGWTVLSSVSGSIEVAFWKDTYANYPPTVADNIFSPNPSLTSTNKNQATGLSIAVAAGDIIIPNVVSVTTCTNVTIAIQITRS